MLYTAGTISATSGSAEISGTGTNWVGSVFPGDNFYIGGAVYPIEEITDSETLTLAIPYIGAAQSGADYAIGKTGGRDLGLAQRVIDLTNRYGATLDGNDQTIAAMQSTVDGVVGEVEAKKAALQTAVDGFIDGAKSGIPKVNLLADGGRFCDGTKVGAGNFVPPSYLHPYNGTSAFSDAGKFIHNNNDFGGSTGHLPESIASLFADLGGGSRYGVEYHVIEFTQGSGGTVTSGGAALSLISGARHIPREITLSYFIRAKTGAFAVPASAKINNEEYDGSLVSDGKWRHVLLPWSSGSGYNNAVPHIYATAGSVVQLCCLSILLGHAVHLDYNHKHPIPGADQLWR